MCPFMHFSGGKRAEIPQKKLNRQADRFDGDLGHKKHKNRLSERPQICRQKNQKTRQTSRQTVSRLGCPRKPNLSNVCLLIYQFFFWREKSTDLKSVDMSTNEQIRFFSADRRPGTIFLRRLSPQGSELFLFPENR